MSAPRSIFAGYPLWDARAGILPHPDISQYRNVIATDAWTNYVGFDGLGQGFFDIPAGGSGATGGLRVFLEQSAIPGAEGNEWSYSIATGTLDVDVDTDAKTITITRANNTTLTGLKTQIDAESELTSVYYDDAATSDTIASNVGETRIDNAHEPVNAIFRPIITNAGNLAMYIGEAPPPSGIALNTGTGIDGVIADRNSNLDTFYLPRGMRVWFHRITSTSPQGSIELWKIADN